MMTTTRTPSTHAAHQADGKHRAGHSWPLEAVAGLRSGQIEIATAHRLVVNPLYAGKHQA